MSGWTWRAPKLITGSGRGDVDAVAGSRRPAGRLREHPEHRGLVQPEPAIARPDAEDDLLGLDRVAVLRAIRAGSRSGPRRRGRGRGGSAPRRCRTGRPAGARTPPSSRADRALPCRGSSRRARSTRRPSRPKDLVRRTSTGQPHQSGSAPVCASSRGWVSGGAEVAASVPYASPRERALSAPREARRNLNLLRLANRRPERRRRGRDDRAGGAQAQPGGRFVDRAPGKVASASPAAPAAST